MKSGDIMHKLTIRNFGPINYCKIDIDKCSVFTGAQTSGKSTIAKTVFYFKTVKDDFYEVIVRNLYHPEVTGNESLLNSIYKRLRSKFIQLFGKSNAMSQKMHISYYFDDDTFINVFLDKNYDDNINQNSFIKLQFSKNIVEFINNIDNNTEKLKDDLKLLFNDDSETIFIPAGRSMITTLTSQLNYFFAVMDTDQKNSMDYCIRKYIELIFKIRPLFSEGIDGYLLNKQYTDSKLYNIDFIKSFLEMSEDILKGKYVYTPNEEKLMIEDDKYVKINFSSSGQQEAVWILNILAYQLINGTKTFLILEEPEAHLYPDAQKKITELLSMFVNANNNVMITTHSPYVLGSINNLLFANQIISKQQNSADEVYDIISENKILNSCKAYHVNDHKVNLCMADDGLIKNEVIDGASYEINEEYDNLFSLCEKMEDC